MIRFSKIIDCPVISIDTGEKLGIVNDIIFISTTREIMALVISVKRIISTTRAVSMADVIKVGESAILIRSESKLIPLEELPGWENTKRYRKDIAEKPVYGDNGINVGAVQDAVFDFEAGVLHEFEISDGVVQDLMEGRKKIPVTESIHLEQGIVIVEKDKMTDIISDGKGLKRFFQKGSRTK